MPQAQGVAALQDNFYKRTSHCDMTGIATLDALIEGAHEGRNVAVFDGGVNLVETRGHEAVQHWAFFRINLLRDVDKPFHSE